MSQIFWAQAGDVQNVVVLGCVFFVLIFLLILFVIFARFFGLWIQSVTTGAGIGIWDLLGMKFRKVNPAIIVRSKIMAVQAGLDDPQISSKALEAHYLAGGNVPLVISAMIAAKKARIITWTINWRRRLIWPGGTFWKRSRRASIRR